MEILSKTASSKKISSKIVKKSIQRTLVNSISLLFGLCCLGVYLVVDVGVDNWANKQFDKSVINHANYLKSLVSIDNEEVKFNASKADNYASYDDDFYYQLWYKNQTIFRSESLNSYPDYHLAQLEMPLNSGQLIHMPLPNGENGRAYLVYFLPDQEILNDVHEHPIYLAFYASDDSLDSQLFFLDCLLIISLFLSLILMRYIAVRIVNNGLQPLQFLNQQLHNFELEHNTLPSERPFIDLQQGQIMVEEIEPIRNELNAFIKENQTFIQNEKRLTGDIAHELKTPIAELISLSEVSIRYPDDPRVNENYKQDMLHIGQKMKEIVDNLLLLHRTSSNSWYINLGSIDLEELIAQILKGLSFEYPDINERIVIDLSSKKVQADKFSLTTILTNLLDNALFYGNKNQPITLLLKAPTSNILSAKHQLIVHNFLDKPLSDKDKKQLLEPLYQSDNSRTFNNRHGLGLSIVHNICKKNYYSLEIQTPASNQVQFVISGI